MPVLNHHIVATHDKEDTALFFSEILGLEGAVKLGEFAVLRVSGDTTLDFVDTDGDFDKLHYAFLITETEFDEIFGRIKRRRLGYWSDPMHDDPDHVNNWDDGRGVYFDDPNGHNLEILTRAYGSGGTECQHPHPLVAPRIERPDAPTFTDDACMPSVQLGDRGADDEHHDGHPDDVDLAASGDSSRHRALSERALASQSDHVGTQRH